MAKIKIEPESLEATSHKISALKLRVAQLENELLKAGNTAPSYEGQFKPRVLGLSTQAKSQLGQRTTTLDTQAVRLEKVAKRFLEADRQFQSSNRFSDFLDQVRNTIGAWLGDLGLGQLSQISLLGALFATDLPRMPWNPKPVYGSDETSIRNCPRVINDPKSKIGRWFKNLIRRIFGGPILLDYSNCNNSEKKLRHVQLEEEIIPEEIIFAKVPDVGIGVKKGEPNKTELGYPRNGYYGVQSNCTWFAAQAVLFFSGDKISINNWGEAGNWLDAAKIELAKGESGFVEGIDKTPKIGDIIVFNTFNHVAFVENVEVIDGEVYVTWVEENATGSEGWGDGQQIIKDGVPILRWRQRRPLKKLTHKADFVHLKY